MARGREPIQTVRAIGLMSGTSMDGVDVAIIETDGQEIVTLGRSGFFPYAEADRALLRGAAADAALLDDRRARPDCLALADAMITSRHVEAVEAFFATDSIDRGTVDFIGFHGHTVLHRPGHRLTVQIGDGKALAKRLGIRVIHDFRAADVAQGGHGAPLVPVFHRALAATAAFSQPVAIINIGGVANLSFIAPGEEPIACDTGPGNGLLDDLMLKRLGAAFDRDGATASRGKADGAVLSELLAHPFFLAPPSKSLDRNDFSGALVDPLAIEDAAATLTAFTTASCCRCCRRAPRWRLFAEAARATLDAGIGGPVALPGRFGGNLRLVERRHGSPGLRLSRGAAGEESADYVSDDHRGREAAGRRGYRGAGGA